MNTKKINSINWWSDDAVTSRSSQSENAGANQAFPNGQFNGLSGNPNGANYPVNNSGSLPPLIQPLVVVPYSTTMQPLGTTDMEKGSGKYYEDIYDDDDDGIVGERKSVKKSAASVAGNIRKRTGAFIALMIFAILLTAVTIIGAFVSTINEYISIFVIKENTFIAEIEPLVGFLSSKIGGLDALGLSDNFTALTVGQEGFGAVSATVLPIVIALYVIVAICTLVASIVGLCRKKASKSNKIALIVFSILMLVFAVASAITGLFAVGMGMSDIMGFFTGSGDFVAGYGLYIMIIMPIVMLICSCCVYGKNKRS